MCVLCVHMLQRRLAIDVLCRALQTVTEASKCTIRMALA